jgi:hypothetical protein
MEIGFLKELESSAGVVMDNFYIYVKIASA